MHKGHSKIKTLGKAPELSELLERPAVNSLRASRLSQQGFGDCRTLMAEGIGFHSAGVGFWEIPEPLVSVKAINRAQYAQTGSTAGPWDRVCLAWHVHEQANNPQTLRVAGDKKDSEKHLKWHSWRQRGGWPNKPPKAL